MIKSTNMYKINRINCLLINYRTNCLIKLKIMRKVYTCERLLVV